MMLRRPHMIYKRRKLQIEVPEVSLTQMGLSFIFGAIAGYFSKGGDSKKDWLFGIAIGGLVTTVCLAGSYVYSRYSSLQSVPSLEGLTNNGNHDNDVTNVQADGDVNTDKKTKTIKTKNQLIDITNDHMTKISPAQLNDGSLYYMAFCFKRGFADLLEGGLISKYLIEKSPFRHSSVMFIPLDIMLKLQKMPTNLHSDYLSEQKGIFVCGRQSTIYRDDNKLRLEASGFFSAERQITKIDNEGLYELFPGAAFESMLSDSIFTGKEIKALIKRVDHLICENKNQACHMYNSNCYSASICMLAMAVESLFDRHVNHLEKIGSSIDFEMHPDASLHVHFQLVSLCSILTDVVKHNQGQGVLNNDLVLTQVNLALEIASLFDYEKSRQLTLDELKKIQFNLIGSNEVDSKCPISQSNK